MDTSTNKDIARRQNLLSGGGKNTIPPHHIVKQQQRLSQTQLASQSRKIIPLEHRELCPLCHRPSFIFTQSKYTTNDLRHNQSSALQLHHGTFLCSKCSNKEIENKLLEINHLKQEIKAKSKIIEPILHKKLSAHNTKYHDNILKAKQYQQRISNLLALIQHKVKQNKLLKVNNDKLRMENEQRLNNLDRLQPILTNKWQSVLLQQTQKYESELNKAQINNSICSQISLRKLLQISDFYKMKVLPTMHNNESKQLSMIQNIAIPSIFKIKNITAFYTDPYNELFRFPVPSDIAGINKTTHNLRINVNTTYPYFNRSSSSLLTYRSRYRSSKYQIPLKTTTRTPKTIRSINIGSSSPLQKYIPRLTNSISSLGERIGIPILTPPGHRQSGMTELESKSLPKNLDDLILPPTFFSDEETQDKEKRNKYKKGKEKERKNKHKHQKREKELNKISGRGRSHSLDALSVPIMSNRLIHEPHIEHGICAALQYIVSFVLHAAKYLNVGLLYRMGLYRKSKRRGFNMHTFIEDNCKGKYFPLYWCHSGQNEEEKKESLGDNNHNILQFEHGLHLLEQNINDLCIKCGVKTSKLQYFQFIANLNALLKHLEKENKEAKDENGDKEERVMKLKRDLNRIEPLNIINNYNTENAYLSREHSTSNSASHSFSESTTAINNSESELLISPQGDAEHDDWDFVDYN